MDAFPRKLITEWRRLKLPTSGTVIVAVSGGADSVSLLLGVADLLKRKKLDLNVIAAHFDHRLRGAESDADAAAVKMLARGLGLHCVTGAGAITKGGNLEQKARDARYDFLAKTASDSRAFAVLTGHTVNDQAETFLINLIRGSGPDGLRGMSPVRSLGNGIDLVRPLLSWAKRTDTEEFCIRSGAACRTDAMNHDLNFRRVRIRKELIPMLADMNPRITETLAATAQLMPVSDILLEGTGPDISIADLLKLDAASMNVVLRRWLEERRGSLRQISREHISAIVRLINSKKSGRVVELPGSGCVVRSGGRLHFRVDGK